MLKKALNMLIVIILNLIFMFNAYAIGTYEEELNKFPESYKSKIMELHNIYPNAIFIAKVPDNYNDKYKCSNKVYDATLNFNTMVDLEYYDKFRNVKDRCLIDHGDGYKSTDSWAYNFYTNEFTGFSGGNWYIVNKDTIKYYLNSLNYLNESNIFAFENLNHNSGSYTIEGIENILGNSFMRNNYCPGSTKLYSEVIKEAAEVNNLNAYFLAARMRLEQGRNKGPLVSGEYPGYEGYYNYFNVQANGKTREDVFVNGLTYAKNHGWNTEYTAIIEGAKFVANGYINDGQDTLYLQKWDATGTCWANHQYMQNVSAPVTEGNMLFKAYKTDSNYKNANFEFFITVWEEVTEESKLPNAGNPNNWLKNLTVNGATVPDFDSAKTDYVITVLNSTTSVSVDYVKVANTSSVKGGGNIDLSSNETKVTLEVTAENGNIRNYNLTIYKQGNNNEISIIHPAVAVSEIINASGIKSDGTYLSGINIGTKGEEIKEKLLGIDNSISVSIKDSLGNDKNSSLATGDKVIITSGDETKEYSIVIYGDVNGDGNIKASDYVLIKNGIMGSKTLSDASLKAADVNKDGSIKASDYVLIKNYIMGSYTITQ